MPERHLLEPKTSQLIEVKLIEARDEFGVVHTDLTLPKDGYVQLEAKGPNGVGDSQITACLSCSNYGAVVSTTAGHEGTVAGATASTVTATRTCVKPTRPHSQKRLGSKTPMSRPTIARLNRCLKLPRPPLRHRNKLRARARTSLRNRRR